MLCAPGAIEAIERAKNWVFVMISAATAVRSIPPARKPTPALELWGGPECTVNRVGDVFGDQFAETRHTGHADEFDCLARIGFAAVRYPLSWERVAPHDPGSSDWRDSDARLSQLRRCGHRVIAGLVHHGSGPRYTDLLNEGFAAGLAQHAQRAAQRYPWIADWTPVNEPLTTARFAALYGLWYRTGATSRRSGSRCSTRSTRLAWRCARCVLSRRARDSSRLRILAGPMRPRRSATRPRSTMCGGG
jgi:hypothetical protein